MSITIDPTIPPKLLAAALKGINYIFPGIEGIILNEVLFNVLYWEFEKIWNKSWWIIRRKRSC